MRRPDVIVVGGGLAGAATAAHAAGAGLEVDLLERDATATQKVCGEFLSGEALGELQRVGIEAERLGAARIEIARIAAGRQVAETPLPFAAAGLSRTRLDPAMRAVAAAAGARLRMGTRVTALAAGSVTTAGGTRLEAPACVAATGKLTPRGLARRRPPRGRDAKIGFKEHLGLAPDAARAVGPAVELHLFEDGYAGLMPIGGGLWNFSLVVGPRRFRQLGGTYPALLAHLLADAPLLAARLRDARRTGRRALAIGDVPYGYRSWADAAARDGIWRVGDQAAVTPSLTGAGMALALRGGRVLARQLVLDPTRPGAGAAALGREFGPQMAWARGVEFALERRATAGALVALASALPSLLGTASRLTRLKQT